jgi:hypothetical protein
VAAIDFGIGKWYVGGICVEQVKVRGCELVLLLGCWGSVSEFAGILVMCVVRGCFETSPMSNMG